MTTLMFRNTVLETISHNGQIWFTSAELAKALQYANSKSISNLYNRNVDEFRLDMTTVIKSMTVRKTGNIDMDVRVFSLRGAHLIAMFARTPVAKEFRKWVLDILDREVGNTQPVITPVRPQAPKFRYIIELTVQDCVTGQKETFKGGANTPQEIISGTARRFGMHIFDMIPTPVTGF